MNDKHISISPIEKEKVVIAKQQEQHTQKPYRFDDKRRLGLTLFEFNPSTGIVAEVEFKTQGLESQTFDLRKKKAVKNDAVYLNPSYQYVWKLNIANAKKYFGVKK